MCDTAASTRTTARAGQANPCASIFVPGCQQHECPSCHCPGPAWHQGPTPTTCSFLSAGRFEDDVAAAKAYDKAAVYLYGSNAITNFGLEACQVDPTEVRTCCKLAVHTAALRGMYQTYSYLCHPSDVAIAQAEHVQHQPLLVLSCRYAEGCTAGSEHICSRLGHIYVSMCVRASHSLTCNSSLCLT